MCDRRERDRPGRGIERPLTRTVLHHLDSTFGHPAVVVRWVGSDAATLTHSLAQLRARICQDQNVILDIGPPDEHPTIDPGSVSRSITACTFRCAVAAAHRRHQAGEALTLMHLSGDHALAVDIATPSNGAVRPGGLYRVPIAQRFVWAFATTLVPDAAFAIGRELVDSATPLDEVHALGNRPDLVTGVCLAYAETTATPGGAHEQAIIDLTLLAAWSVFEHDWNKFCACRFDPVTASIIGHDNGDEPRSQLKDQFATIDQPSATEPKPNPGPTRTQLPHAPTATPELRLCELGGTRQRSKDAVRHQRGRCARQVRAQPRDDLMIYHHLQVRPPVDLSSKDPGHDESDEQ